MNVLRLKSFVIFVLALAAAAMPFGLPALAASEDSVVRIMDEDEKAVYLTFDDGPDKVNTISVMETLKKYDVQATFFFVGANMKTYPDVVKQVYDNGFSIGNHSYSHATLTRLSAAGIKGELDSFNNLLQSIIGEKTAIMRPPGGALNDAAKKTIASLGYKTYLWTIDPRDWSNKDNSLILSEIKQNLKPGAVILLHASPGHKRASQILPELIEYIQAEGYELRALPDPGYKSLPARLSSSEILLNGERINISPYLIDGVDYVKIRDFAGALSETEKHFGVSWNEKAKRISLLTDCFYIGEPSKNAGQEARRAALSPVTVMIDGKPAAVTVYSINGSNYFNIEELTGLLGIELSYDSGKNIARMNIPLKERTP